MTRQEAEHALNMLIELQLIKAIKATREGKFKEEKKMIEEFKYLNKIYQIGVIKFQIAMPLL